MARSAPYVDCTRRSDAKRTTREMGKRMPAARYCFLPRASSTSAPTSCLFGPGGAAQHAMEAGAKVMIQPLTAYTRLQGLPVSRNDRSLIARIKSKSVKENVREILTGGSRK
jgi:1-acyl-sn-glycerol-3-phosphate acyltransferase